MKGLLVLIIVGIVLCSCLGSYEQIDLTEARKTVVLDSIDLNMFQHLKEELIHDSSILREQDERVNSYMRQYDWHSTNSYYLNQIDSSKYASLYAGLQGKIKDKISVSKAGNVLFTLKENVQMHMDDYNETYSHLLISKDCRCPMAELFNHIDTIYIDSVVNRDWRYVSLKLLTGH